MVTTSDLDGEPQPSPGATTPEPSGLPAVPALVVGQVTHTRRAPLKHRFRYRMYQWLVDVDDLPRLPRWLRPFSSFRAADHIGDPERTLRENIEAFCRAQGLEIGGRRILMLANARTAGHVFDPLSVFWILDGDHTEAIVAEVHNTYGERHAYLLQPDDRGRTTTDKAFYVSPFFTVAGRYDLQFRLDRGAVSSTVVLRQSPRDADGDSAPAAPAEAVFSATFRGVPHLATPRRLVRTLATMPFMTHRISLLIRIHGVRLWLRRLPVVPRPAHEPQEGTR